MMTSPSPSPGPNLTGGTAQNVAVAPGILGAGGPPRRVSTAYMQGMSGLGPPGTGSTGANASRAMTPPAQHSPNSNTFLASLSSRLLQSRTLGSQYPGNIGRSGLNELIDAVNGHSLLTNFRSLNSVHHSFGLPSGPPSSLDLSEFPSLGGNSTGGSLLGNSGSSGAPGSSRPPYVGMVKDVGHIQQPSTNSSEFTIHSEDFPALPGSNVMMNSGHDVSSSVSVSGTGLSGIIGSGSSVVGSNFHSNSGIIGTGSSIHSLSGDGQTSAGINMGPQNYMISSGKNVGKRGIQTSKDGRVTNIPPGMVTDQFGMVGLLTFIRVAESDPNLVSLALGTDLTTLRLDLNSPENLYSTFPGPWSDQPLKSHEIDYPVPQEYLINHQIRDKLAPIKLNKYGDDILFFLFYMFPNDVIQVAAANELYGRDWRYHKDEKVWITRAPGMPPMEKTPTYERGTYYFFDAINWRRVAKEFHLDYDRLENRPPAVGVNHGTIAPSLVQSSIGV